MLSRQFDHLLQAPMPSQYSQVTGDPVLNLEKRTGYNIQQTNGQRRMGPPPDWVGPPPPKGSEVFVGSLPRNMYEDELFPIFASIGKIYELRLMLDFSMSNRGYAFVMYTNPEDARKAVKILNNFEINPGKKIGVVMSKDNCRLYVGHIPRHVTREQIFEEMSQLTENVVNVIVKAPKPSSREDYPKTIFAFVEYGTHHDAAMARRKLLPCKFQLFASDSVTVDWAQPEEEADEEIMSTVTNLYVRNFRGNVSEEELHHLFSFDGQLQVTKVKIINDFAFVHYGNRKDAETAYSMATSGQGFGSSISSNGYGLDIKWAKPPELNRNRKSNRFGLNEPRGGYSNHESRGYNHQYNQGMNGFDFYSNHRLNPDSGYATVGYGRRTGYSFNRNQYQRQESLLPSYATRTVSPSGHSLSGYPWNQQQNGNRFQSNGFFDRQEVSGRGIDWAARRDERNIEPQRVSMMSPTYFFPSPASSPILSGAEYQAILQHPVTPQSLATGVLGSLNIQATNS